MSVKYVPVIWNRNKLVYDAIVLAGIAVYIYAFLRLGGGFDDLTRPVDGAVLRMRAFGSCAFFLLTVILCIGPLARLGAGHDRLEGGAGVLSREHVGQERGHLEPLAHEPAAHSNTHFGSETQRHHGWLIVRSGG